MTHRLLAALTILASGALPVALPQRAQAQSILDNAPPAVRQVMNQLRRTCVSRGRIPIFSPDFLFGTDADQDGDADDIFLTDVGFSCLTRAQRDAGEGPHGGTGMQWLFVKGRGPLRLVWSGRHPDFALATEEGLVVYTGRRCGDHDCQARRRWNGRGFVPVRSPDRAINRAD